MFVKMAPPTEIWQGLGELAEPANTSHRASTATPSVSKGRRHKQGDANARSGIHPCSAARSGPHSRGVGPLAGPVAGLDVHLGRFRHAHEPAHGQIASPCPCCQEWGRGCRLHGS